MEESEDVEGSQKTPTTPNEREEIVSPHVKEKEEHSFFQRIGLQFRPQSAKLEPHQDRSYLSSVEPSASKVHKMSYHGVEEDTLSLANEQDLGYKESESGSEKKLPGWVSPLFILANSSYQGSRTSSRGSDRKSLHTPDSNPSTRNTPSQGKLSPHDVESPGSSGSDARSDGSSKKYRVFLLNSDILPFRMKSGKKSHESDPNVTVVSFDDKQSPSPASLLLPPDSPTSPQPKEGTKSITPQQHNEKKGRSSKGKRTLQNSTKSLVLPSEEELHLLPDVKASDSRQRSLFGKEPSALICAENRVQVRKVHSLKLRQSGLQHPPTLQSETITFSSPISSSPNFTLTGARSIDIVCLPENYSTPNSASSMTHLADISPSNDIGRTPQNDIQSNFDKSSNISPIPIPLDCPLPSSTFHFSFSYHSLLEFREWLLFLWIEW